MKIHICNDNKVFPFLYVDDWYTPEEEKLIWKELDFYTNSSAMRRAEDSTEEDRSRPGKNEDGTFKNKAWRMDLDSTHTRREVSHILRLQPQKMKSLEMLKAIEESGPSFRMYESSNYDVTVLNYSEGGDYYASHNDTYMISTSTWLHRTPKAYTGGDITFTDIDVTLECNHNRIVMFPSYYYHEIHPIKMEDINLASPIGWPRAAMHYLIKSWRCLMGRVCTLQATRPYVSNFALPNGNAIL